MDETGDSGGGGAEQQEERDQIEEETGDWGGEGETEQQEEREHGPEDKRGEHRQLRRGGMPALIFTERQGDLFTHISMPSADAELLAVAALRNVRLRELGATEP